MECKPSRCTFFSIQNRQALENLLKNIDEQIAKCDLKENKHKLVRVLMESKNIKKKYDEKEKLYKATIQHINSILLKFGL